MLWLSTVRYTVSVGIKSLRKPYWSTLAIYSLQTLRNKSSSHGFCGSKCLLCRMTTSIKFSMYYTFILKGNYESQQHSPTHMCWSKCNFSTSLRQTSCAAPRGFLWMDDGINAVSCTGRFSRNMLYVLWEVKGNAWWKGYSHERVALWYLAPPAVIPFESRERGSGSQVYMSAGKMAQGPYVCGTHAICPCFKIFKKICTKISLWFVFVDERFMWIASNLQNLTWNMIFDAVLGPSTFHRRSSIRLLEEKIQINRKKNAAH